MHLIAEIIRISHAKFHCNRLTTLQDTQDYASLIFGTHFICWLDLSPWRRGCMHGQLHEAAPCRSMLSHLCCLMNVEVTLLTVVLHHVNPSFLGSSLLPCLLYIRGLECQFRMIHFFAHYQKTAIAVAVCDLLRSGVDQAYHTPLYSWSCLCKLLLQSSSNRTFQIPVVCVCFKVQVSE